MFNMNNVELFNLIMFAFIYFFVLPCRVILNGQTSLGAIGKVRFQANVRLAVMRK